MQDLFVSLNANKLRISTVDPKVGFKSYVDSLTKNVVHDTKIQDAYTFASILGESISRVTRLSKNKLLLNFVLEPQNVVLRFFSLGKGVQNGETDIIKEIKTRLNDINLDELYFSYQKIAPFMYQFIGIKKEILESYIEVSNSLGIGLKSVIPWVLLLPKYLNVNSPTIFVVKRDDRQVLALSELNGIFFIGVYDEERSSKELQDFINQLSFYKKSEPIKKIYTLNYESFSLSDYEVAKIDLPITELDTEGIAGFELNVLTNFMIDQDATVVSGQTNAINLLPLPVVIKKSAVKVYVGVATAIVVLAGVFVGLKVLGKPQNNQNSLAQNTTQQNVLSEAKSSSESTQTQNNTSELKKADLKVRVENGTGVSGLAAKTKELLKGFGYNVVSIDTAKTDRKDTLLRFKKDKVVYKDMVLTDVKAKFPNIVVEDTLSGSVDYDLLLVIGGNTNL